MSPESTTLVVTIADHLEAKKLLEEVAAELRRLRTALVCIRDADFMAPASELRDLARKALGE
jgi:hypothetical protein